MNEGGRKQKDKMNLVGGMIVSIVFKNKLMNKVSANEGLWVGINMVNLFDMNVEIEGILRNNGSMVGSWWTQTRKKP